MERFETLRADTRAKIEPPFHSLTTHFKHSATRSQGLGKNEAQLVSRVGLRIFCISMNETIRIVFDTEISHPRANSSMASGRA